MPRGVVLAESFKLGFITRNINENNIIHRVGNKKGVILICVIMVAIIRKLYGTEKLAILVNKADEGNIVGAVVADGNRLGLIRGDSAIVTSATVIKEHKTVASPELVTYAVVNSLNVTGLCAAGDGIESPYFCWT